MTSVAMAFQHGSGALGARTEVQATAEHGSRFRSVARALIVRGEDLDGLPRGLGLGLLLGLGLWSMAGSVAWLLLV
jgi:hypothetical protein